ncbi:MAG: NADH-quinone oxidoreductase subunit A [Proteobacteria bacterium]|nr:NADH-quinone oxidoreductase subunit A [Pseudomonadota bacterium]
MINYLNYLPILIFIGVAFGLSILLVLISFLRAKRNPYIQKETPYECGFDTFDLPVENTRHKFTVQFYLVAILFIIFDLEIALLFPWAISLFKLGFFGFYTVLLFLLILAIGFAYEWRKGALDWE